MEEEENLKKETDSASTDDNEETQSESEVKEDAGEKAEEVKVEESVDNRETKEKPVQQAKPHIQKEGSMKKVFLTMGLLFLVSMVVVFLWDKIPAVKNGVHSILDPTAGFLLGWDLTLGMLIIVFVLTFITMIVQKFATDQEALRELKKEQKEVQKEMKNYRDNPEKMKEIQKSVLPTTLKIFELTVKSSMFTIIPFVLFFRWFNDYFSAMPEFKFFGFLSWILFYLIFAMVFSAVIKKILKLA